MLDVDLHVAKEATNRMTRGVDAGAVTRLYQPHRRRWPIVDDGAACARVFHVCHVRVVQKRVSLHALPTHARDAQQDTRQTRAARILWKLHLFHLKHQQLSMFLLAVTVVRIECQKDVNYFKTPSV